MKKTHAKILWKKLENKYTTKSLEIDLVWKKELLLVSIMSINDHIHAFDKIVVNLLNLDKKKVLLLLNSLPDEYEHLTTTSLYGKDKITFDVVHIALLNFECKKDKKVKQKR